MTCNYDAVTLRSPAKQFSHCIALTINNYMEGSGSATIK